MTGTVYDLDFSRAWGAPLVEAQLKASPEDFRVDEVLDITPGAQGEHWLVQLRKRGENTAWVAGQLAALAGVPVRDLGYCGLKDRHAVTSQWFSLYQPVGTEPDWTSLEAEGRLQILQAGRTPRKLRRGDHQGNDFVIRLRQLTGLKDPTRAELERRLGLIADQGVPNYFGAQRFGRQGGNLVRARTLLVERRRIRDRQQRSMALSAARSWLFNQVLSARVARGDWQTPLPGEPEPMATGPLWGRGRALSGEATLTLEDQVLAPWRDWCAGLEQVGLKQERRPLVLQPRGFAWRWQEEDLELGFGLPPGTFATSVLRELASVWESDERG